MPVVLVVMVIVVMVEVVLVHDYMRHSKILSVLLVIQDQVLQELIGLLVAAVLVPEVMVNLNQRMVVTVVVDQQ